MGAESRFQRVGSEMEFRLLFSKSVMIKTEVEQSYAKAGRLKKVFCRIRETYTLRFVCGQG